MPLQRVFEKSFNHVLLKTLAFSWWKMASSLRSVENDIYVLGRFYDPLLFYYRSASICCFLILSHPISSNCHQAVVNINLCQIDIIVIGDIRRFTGLSIAIVYLLDLMRRNTIVYAKQSSSTVFVLLCILYRIIFLRVRFGDIRSSKMWPYTEKHRKRGVASFWLWINRIR
jgi:hypothetical protein